MVAQAHNNKRTASLSPIYFNFKLPRAPWSGTAGVIIRNYIIAMISVMMISLGLAELYNHPARIYQKQKLANKHSALLLKRQLY